MKQVILSLILLAALGLISRAQQVSIDVKPTAVETSKADTIKKVANQDTTIVRIGEKDIKVIDHNGGTEIIWGKDKHRKDKSDKFDGHWSGVDFGFNSFAKTDYSMYNPSDKDFMSLNQGKSLEFDFNFYQFDLGLGKYVGFVSGMGFSFNNYRFENPYTLKRGQQLTEPMALNPENLSKTKLAVSYLNVPLLLEFQIPMKHHEDQLYISGGLIGGVKLGSHTKVKYGDKKEKDRSGFNINSFNYAATARIGYKDFGLFAKYSLTPLFQSGKGPDLTPFTIGISFLD